MIFFSGAGYLGNHLFQMGFLEMVANDDEWIIVRTMDDFFQTFPRHRRVLYAKNYFLKKLVAFLYLLVLPFLARLGLFDYYSQDYEMFRGTKWFKDTLKIKKGLSSRIKVIEPGGFFQSEFFFAPSYLSTLSIKAVHRRKAREFLNQLPKDQRKVFIHVRLLDFRDQVVFGKADATLPNDYYLRGMEYFKKAFGPDQVIFVFISNDPKKVAEIFGQKDNHVFTKGESASMDFATMTLCDGGVTSCSTFSWWGAYLMKKGNLVIAPKYWMGHKSKIWFPVGIETHRFVFIDPDLENNPTNQLFLPIN